VGKRGDEGRWWEGQRGERGKKQTKGEEDVLGKHSKREGLSSTSPKARGLEGRNLKETRERKSEEKKDGTFTRLPARRVPGRPLEMHGAG